MMYLALTTVIQWVIIVRRLWEVHLWKKWFIVLLLMSIKGLSLPKEAMLLA